MLGRKKRGMIRSRWLLKGEQQLLLLISQIISFIGPRAQLLHPLQPPIILTKPDDRRPKKLILLILQALLKPRMPRLDIIGPGPGRLNLLLPLVHDHKLALVLGTGMRVWDLTGGCDGMGGLLLAYGLL